MYDFRDRLQTLRFEEANASTIDEFLTVLESALDLAEEAVTAYENAVTTAPDSDFVGDEGIK